VRSVLLSTLLHAVVLAALFYLAHLWHQYQPKTYIVNLVPSVAAVGSPRGRPLLPPQPAKAPEPPPPAPPTELPQRAAPRELPARESVGLPERSLPPRAAALPRAGERDLPSLASPKAATTPPLPRSTPPPSVATPVVPRPESLGQRTGSTTGAGAVTLNVSDFPFAWYLSRVQAKITERWSGRALPGQQPVAVFDIGRDGRMSGLTISKSSGNAYYDQAAVRAISEADPFPPLPEGFPGTSLRIHLGFNFASEQG